MKKLFFTIASLMFVAIVSVNAQDATKTGTEKSAVTTTDASI